MENICLDKNGRMVLPKKIREKFDTNVFEIETEKNKIVLKPLESLKSVMGKYPGLDIEEFRKERKKEIENEHFA